MLNQYILKNATRFCSCTNFAPTSPIRYQAISLNIASALLQHAESQKLGRVLPAPCNVILSGIIVMQPDIVFIKNERRGLIEQRSLRGAPDLVVEVLPAGIRKKGLKAKKRIYEHYEVQEYWLVDPDGAAIETMIWSELGYISVCVSNSSDKLSSPLLPNLNLDLSRIFKAGDCQSVSNRGSSRIHTGFS